MRNVLDILFSTSLLNGPQLHKQRIFHVLEVCKVTGAHKQALANHACVRSSIKAMSASVHEAEVLLNAAPTAIDPDDQLSRRTCIPDDDPRVEAIGERTDRWCSTPIQRNTSIMRGPVLFPPSQQEIKEAPKYQVRCLCI